MQRFFTDTVESDFVKSILANTPLYTLQTCKDGDFIIKGYQYIYNNYVIICTKSGYIAHTDAYYRASYQTKEILDGKELSKRMYHKYVSTYTYYDSLTHKYLGDYLRQFRDLKGIDLMPFYNCFCNQFTSGIRLFTELMTNSEGSVVSKTSVKVLPSSQFKIALVPVKLNQKYTIAIDSQSNVYIAPIFLNGNVLVEYSSSSSSTDLTEMINQEKYFHIKQYNELSYNNPILYEFNLISMFQEDETQLRLFKSYERYLYLLIQLPATNDSSIVVLEGDYTDNNTQHIFSADNINVMSQNEKNYLMLSRLSLLQFNCRIQVPYSNRLLEYLTQNVITNQDTFWKDISKVQEYVDPNKLYTPYPGIWDDSLRVSCFNKSMKSPIVRKLDLNGFVDKDVENMFMRGRVYDR